MKKRTSDAQRKQRQRAKLRGAGKTRLETWISPTAKGLISSFSKKAGLDLRAVSEIILESATPLFLREIERLLVEIAPSIQRIRLYEYYGIRPLEIGGSMARFQSRNGFVELHPREHHDLLIKAGPSYRKLLGYGLKKPMIYAASAAIAADLAKNTAAKANDTQHPARP